MKIRPSAFIVKDNQLLTLTYSYNNEFLYALPGGNLEEHENVTSTLIRELEEELQVIIEVKELLCMAETYNVAKRSKVLHITFIAEIVSGVPNPNPVETTTLGVKWIPLSELPLVNLYPNISSQITKYQENASKGVFLGEIDQKWI